MILTITSNHKKAYYKNTRTLQRTCRNKNKNNSLKPYLFLRFTTYVLRVKNVFNKTFN